MGSKVCISKTLIYLIFLTVVVSTFLYVVGRINRQELTTQSQASMSVFMNNQTCSTKTGDQSAICVKKFSNKVICGKNKKRSYGISIDGTNTNLGNFDCDSSVFREGRCCTSDQYIIPTLTRSERSKLTQPSPKLRKAKGRGITSSGICSDGQFVTKCIFGSKDYSSGPAVCPNNPPKHETVEGCKPPDARRCGEYDIDQCVASQSRCYWDSTKEGCLEKLNISSCNVFTCPSNSQLQFSAKCQNPNFGGCGGIWKVYPGSGCLGKSLSFELPHSLYSQPLEYIQNSGIVYYCASTLKETVLNVILKTNKTLNYNYQNPIATFKICFSSHNNLVSVCPFEEKIDLSKIKENGYYINKTFKNSESKSLFTWYLTYEPVGIELFNPTLYGYLIEENGKITGDVFIN